MNKTRDGLLLSSAQSAPLTIEEKWSINMGEAGEKTDFHNLPNRRFSLDFFFFFSCFFPFFPFFFFFFFFF